jgi:hypothetical protein
MCPKNEMPVATPTAHVQKPPPVFIWLIGARALLHHGRLGALDGYDRERPLAAWAAKQRLAYRRRRLPRERFIA